MSTDNPFVGFSTDEISTSVEPGDVLTDITFGPLPLAFKRPSVLILTPSEDTAYYIEGIVDTWDGINGVITSFLVTDVGDLTDTSRTSFNKWKATREHGGTLSERVAISNTTNDLTEGLLTFTVPGGRAFRIDATLDIYPLDAHQQRGVAKVVYYDDTTLTCNVNSTFKVTPLGFSSAAPNVAGSGYNVGETITLTGGTFGTAAVVSVDEIDPTTGAVLAASIADAGDYSVLPSNPVSQDSTSGIGSGATFDLVSTITHDRWYIEQIDEPAAGIPLYSLNGLRVTVNATDSAHDIDISAGSVRDSTDTIDLVLPSAMTKQLDAQWAVGTNQGAMICVALTGTVSCAAGGDVTVTGTGTAFLTDVAPVGTKQAFLSDWDAQVGTSDPQKAVVSFGSVTGGRAVNSVASNTSMVVHSSGAASAQSLFRNTTLITSVGTNAIVIARKDGDGATDIISTSFTASGEPDMPNGYTYYRVIAKIDVETSVTPVITQPLAFAQEAAEPGLSLLNTLTASTSSALDDTTHITSAYDAYEFSLENIILSSATASLLIQVTEDGGANWKTTGYVNTGFTVSSVPATGTLSGTTNGISCGPANAASSDPGLNGTLVFQNPNSASGRKSISGSLTGNSRAVVVAGYFNSTTNAANGVRFTTSTGTITSGKIRAYGRKTS